MGDVLDEAYGIMQCKECPWYKNCIMPMRLTAEDLRRQMMATPGSDITQQSSEDLQNLVSSMATAAQNSLLEGCPILIERLRSNPKLVQQIKCIMQNWSKDEDST
jgi:hypothetical protein